MNIPTTSFVQLPSNFLADIFGIVGYILSNIWVVIVISIGISLAIFVVYLIISIIRGE